MPAALPLEERVAVLEVEVEQLKVRVQRDINGQAVWWERIIGVFADDSAFEEAMQLGREYRESQRHSAAP